MRPRKIEFPLPVERIAQREARLLHLNRIAAGFRHVQKMLRQIVGTTITDARTGAGPQAPDRRKKR